MSKKVDNHYLKPDRLADVIRLLVVLSVDKHSFRSEEGLTGIHRDNPKSANNWLELAQEHPEFFRFNKEKTSIILLIRFLQKVDVLDGELREPLSVDQTQKLVDQAIELHDKQLARYQRDSSKNAIVAAVIAAISTIIVGLITLYSTTNSNKELKNDLEILKKKLNEIEVKIEDNITPTKTVHDK
ncbi:hypothetical protein [Flavobacterium sp.]|uniref:hypothetical protein n=1 Tax=Flavobacterium sp. TaxID=239 RepID=UPI0026358259|nr:hypothetical protein [Flavobacterium sp.]